MTQSQTHPPGAADAPAAPLTYGATRPPAERGRVARAARSVVESIFLWPLLILLGLLVLYPTSVAVLRSFYDWNPGGDSPFVGLQNYYDVVGDNLVREIARNELIFALGIPLWVTLPLVVALILHERVPIPGLWRTIMFFPSVLSPVVLGLLFRSYLRPDGLLNASLDSIGLGGLTRSWIDDPSLVKPVIILVVAWYTLGLGVLLYGAALTAVPAELFEAAELDGATWFQRLRYVMVPAIIPMLVLNTIFSAAQVFFLFGYIYSLTQGGPGYSSTTIDYDIFQQAAAYGNFGFAAAESTLMLCVMLVIIATIVWVGRRQWQ